jgi:hypothetical protein
VDFDRWARRLGLAQDGAAEHLHLAPGTLAQWQRRWRQDHLAPRPLGRPARRSDVASRHAAIDLMNTVGPRIGLPALRHAFPRMAHRELANLQARFRRLWRLDNRYFGHVLHWHRPGAVWAMDHAKPPQPIDARWPYLLAVRDLASGCQLAWLPVPDETAQTTIDALQGLFLEHGPPLVLKSDNGPGFIAEDTRAFLDHWQVWPLFSPPYLPEYNGAIEAGNGSLKLWTHQQAARQGRTDHWTADDCEAARCMANQLSYPCGCHKPTPADAWRLRPPLTREDRTAFGRALQQQRDRTRQETNYPLQGSLGLPAQAAIDRVAIRRALVEHGLLTFTRRLITPPLHARLTSRIS